jgi:hypothetical protein
MLPTTTSPTATSSTSPALQPTNPAVRQEMSIPVTPVTLKISRGTVVPKQVIVMAVNSSNATTATMTAMTNARTVPELATRTTAAPSRATQTSPVPRPLSPLTPKPTTAAVSGKRLRTNVATLRNLLIWRISTLKFLDMSNLQKCSPLNSAPLSQISVSVLPPCRAPQLLSPKVAQSRL